MISKYIIAKIVLKYFRRVVLKHTHCEFEKMIF